ncbi:MAG: arylsulfatase, partial [Sulfurovum sp.]|nr:arylsulfatase [Sulfurovum sp.]
KEKLASKEGMKANGKNFRVHLDGYNFKPYFEGKAEKGPRREIYYFAASGMLNALRVDDWKLAFAIEDGPINEAYRKTPAWPVITNLRADPFESAQHDSQMYIRWMADNMWMMVPAQGFVQKFLGSIEGYPFQAGSSLSAGNIGYGTLEMQKAKGGLKRLLDKAHIN